MDREKGKTASFCIHLTLTLVRWLHSITRAEEILTIIMAWKVEIRIIQWQRKVSN